ncbi:MAG TPA: FG-GAP-like repeat-containing protein [Candidatus Binatia bacterium]|jgi:hypothetical protein
MTDRRSTFAPAARRAAVFAALLLLALPRLAVAEFPWPPCNGCPDTSDYKAYMHTVVTNPPALPNEVGQYDFRASSLVDPSLPNSAEELSGVAGMSIDTAWQLTTGRPDVLVAHLDSGIRYDSDNVRKAALNAGELPLPEGSAVYDRNGDGVFNIEDYFSTDPSHPYQDSRVHDADGNGIIDPRDLILIFSDGVDTDHNGYVDDICGWDVHENDNDPFDDAGYGHGTGESKDSSGEANNGGSWGVSPNGMFVPIKVADSFVADGNDFGKGVAYALDRGVSVISEALGALNNTKLAQDAVEYAFQRGVPMVLSAADEQSYHHNFPAVYAHGFWANSVRPDDNFLVTNKSNLLLNGCTNFSGRADVAIASNSCSSEATGRSAGIFSLMLSQAKNQIERGAITADPHTGKPLSPLEIYQLMKMTADDIDFSSTAPNTLTPNSALLSIFPNLTDERFPSHAGFDKFFGYGRANVRHALDRIAAGTIPPEADITSPGWFTNFDPSVTASLPIHGTVAAYRDSNNASYVVDWACGVAPLESEFATHTIGSGNLGGTAIEDGPLASLDTASTAAACGFAGITLPRTNEDDFDESYAITIRVTVQDSLGNVGQARRNVTLHQDAGLLPGFPISVSVSGDSPPLLHDLDKDGAQDIVFGASDGKIHALHSDGTELSGWPVQTHALALPSTVSFGDLGTDYHSAVLAGIAIGDIDQDGNDEVIAADMDGSVYAFHRDGTTVSGFPATLNPAFSAPSLRNQANRLDYGVIASPTLADLDGDGKLEILVAAMDRHLYVFNNDGTQHTGFPVLVVDQSEMSSVNADNGQVVWKTISGQSVGSIGTKLLSSPSVGDIDGDGKPDIVIGSNEEYVRGETANFFINNSVFNGLMTGLDLPNGRVYAISHLGNLDPAVASNPSGPFLPGWPVKIGLLISDLLPTVGHGVTAAPVLADIDDDGDDEVFINGNNGPAYLLQGDGTSVFGASGGKYKVMSPVLTAGNNPDASSNDFPLTFGLLGGGAAGDFFSSGVMDFALPSVGGHQLLDAQGPALQGPGDHQMMAWSADGKSLPAFPARNEDLQFLSSPAIADVDGDGVAEILQGSGGYYLHAFGANGGEPTGWPKFTGGWMVGSATAGDINGDGKIDVVAITREGNLYAWGTGADYERTGAKSVQWATASHDVQRSGNINSGVATSPSPGGCSSEYRSVIQKVSLKHPDGAANDKFLVSGFVNMTGRTLDPVANDVEVTVGGPDAAQLDVVIPHGSFKANATGTTFSYSAKAPGVTKVKLQLKNGFWRWQLKGSDVDATPSDERVFARVRVGGVCFERSRSCVPNTKGDALKCVPPM